MQIGLRLRETLVRADLIESLRHLVADHAALGLMTILHNGNRWDRSNVVFRAGQLLQYDKRAQTPEMAYIDYGAALLRDTAIERIPADQPYDLADLYRALVADRRMIGYEVTQRFYEIGSHAGLAETQAYLQPAL